MVGRVNQRAKENYWHGDCKTQMRLLLFGFNSSVEEGSRPTIQTQTHQENSHMSPKQQKKFRGVRRVNRRPRGWARWFREGLLDFEPRGGMRLRLALTPPRGP
jgi:hypothetical protein